MADDLGRWGDSIPSGTVTLSRLTLAERERIVRAVFGEPKSVTELYVWLIGVDAVLSGAEVERGYPTKAEAMRIREEVARGSVG